MNSSIAKGSSGAIEKLRNDIDNALCKNSDSQDFLPNDKLSQFVHRERIRSVLRPSGCFDNMDDLITFIREKAPRLFLTLVMIDTKNLEQELKHFQDVGFDDRVLPIQFRDNLAHTLQKIPDPTPYSLASKWKRNERVLFEEWQRRFTVPVFGTPNNFHHQLLEGQRLPFLDVAPRPASSGYFGEVTKIIIHAKHIDPSINLPAFGWPSKTSGEEGENFQIDAVAIAVKKTREGDDDPRYSRVAFFDKELGNLNLLREHKYRSSHIIVPISGYQIGQSRCLMFPWADGGNLGDYWIDQPSHARNVDDVLWQLCQFVEICDALTELHGTNCRHGDLKPENILWFDRKINRGTLKIADLGLATFHEKEANTGNRNRKGMPTQTPSGTSRYEPPEMDAQRGAGEARSRQYDIWSLGCIILELLLWLAYSPSDITIFRDNTPYFWQKGSNPEHDRYIVHEYVVAVMEDLDSHFEPHTAYKDLLNLVRKRLLVVKFSNNYGAVSNDDREVAAKVHQYFANIVQDCKANENYLKPLTEKLPYPAAKLDKKAPHRNEFQRNEVHEKDGKLAVPGEQLIAKPALDTSQIPAEISDTGSLDISDPGPDIPRLALRQATLKPDGNTLNSQASQTSNHQEVCPY